MAPGGAPNGRASMEQDIVGNSNAKRSSFEVAIVGGGIVGLCIAKGLVARHIPVTVYEQALEFHEIGAGIGFARNIMECLRALDAQLYDILARMSIQGQGVRWVDGTRREDIRQRPVDQLADSEMQEDYLLTNSFLRAQVANAVAGLIPDHCLKLGKRLVKLEQTNAEKVYLEFHDGEKAVVDAVIGCDGVKSYVRREVVGEDEPSAVAHFAGEVAWRCLLDMDQVSPVMGQYARKMFMWHGPGACMVTYPVADFRFLNVAAFVQTKEWAGGDSHTAKGTKKDAVVAFSQFGPLIRGLVDLFPDEVNQWAMFDTLDNPLRSFAFGLVALAGDAAHAMCPHNGQGAGMGIEDGLVLATLLERGAEILRSDGTGIGVSKPEVLRNVFEAYNAVRRERAQFVVWSSRRQGILQKWEDAQISNDIEWLVRDTKERYERIFKHEWRGMVDEAIKDLEDRVHRGA